MADVKTSQTWTAAASPHVVGQSINVLGNSTLTIEPCATVLLDPAVTIAVGDFVSSPADKSVVVALGTQAQPITFGPHGSSPWGSLYLNNAATATLSWVTFTGGGDVVRHGASLILESGNATTTLLPMASLFAGRMSGNRRSVHSNGAEPAQNA